VGWLGRAAAPWAGMSACPRRAGGVTWALFPLSPRRQQAPPRPERGDIGKPFHDPGRRCLPPAIAVSPPSTTTSVPLSTITGVSISIGGSGWPSSLPRGGGRGEKSHRPSPASQGQGEGKGRQSPLRSFAGGPRFAETSHASCSPAMMRKEGRQCGNGFHDPEGGGGGGGGGPGC